MRREIFSLPFSSDKSSTLAPDFLAKPNAALVGLPSASKAMLAGGP